MNDLVPSIRRVRACQPPLGLVTGEGMASITVPTLDTGGAIPPVLGAVAAAAPGPGPADFPGRAVGDRLPPRPRRAPGLPDLSVVIPARDEAGAIGPLLAEIALALAGICHEIIVVNDGSTDATARVVAEAAREHHQLALLTHARSHGQSAAIRSGVDAALGRIIVTLDADGQNDPADIPRLLALYRTAGQGRDVRMVAGQRRRRHDSLVKRLSSRLANRVRGALLGDGVTDTGCGLKVFDRATYQRLPYFDHMHRFLPALIQREGGVVLTHPVNHRPRSAGHSKYGTWNRLWVGIVDLAGVMWLGARMSRPEVLPEILPEMVPGTRADARREARS
ncbi:glycosyltransferase family 2 protein [Ancylobacter sp. FA202]|uniref:glycosyltransferase family 2 protein n=1 Tax=Ancylobacter sp. FA202 TaxID=1111106 RepID=UPI0003A548CA|nr:glycosyltransferase family 2 protein [Ancylobacter sp. FA202]